MSFLFNQLINLKNFKLNPAQYLLLGFLLLIGVGAMALYSPWATPKGSASLSLVDSLFMAISAVCVTGLSVITPAHDLSLFGQIVLIILIQIGGLGFMTFSTLMMVIIGKKLGFKERILIKESFNQLSLAGLVQLVKKVVIFALVIEVIGGLLLAFSLWDTHQLSSIYLGFWHAISAFCNAGFDLFGSQSLSSYVNTAVLPIISLLIVLGGLGFSVINDIINYRQHKKIGLHSRMVVILSATLIVIGAVGFLLLESKNHNTLGGIPWTEKISHSLFQSIVARTAGFSSINIQEMTESSTLLMIVLMFIGAAPASTGGGIKITTAFILILALWTYLKNQKEIVFQKRSITNSTVNKAMTVAILAIIFINLVLLTLLITETESFLPLLFETTSAFATVGLSMGITPNLTNFGKILIGLTMLVGRLGILTIMFAIVIPKKESLIEHPRAQILIG